MRIGETMGEIRRAEEASNRSTKPTVELMDLDQQKLRPGKVQNKRPIRVLLVDDHPVVRKGLSSYLAEQEQVCIIGEAVDGQDALRTARELSPDLVLLDIDMPHM